MTKAQPKEMLPVVDKPVIQYVVEEAILSGIEDILIVTGRNKRSIEDHFDRCPELEIKFNETCMNIFKDTLNDLSLYPEIHYVRQRDQRVLVMRFFSQKTLQWGTIRGLLGIPSPHQRELTCPGR